MDRVLSGEIIFISQLTRNRGKVPRWFYLWAVMESWLMAIDCLRRHTGTWSYMKRSTCQHENERKTHSLEWMLYSVYTVLGECCTWCMLYLVYAVLSINSWSRHGDIQWDDLTLYSGMMVELLTRKREIGMKLRMMCRIQAQIWNLGHDLSDVVVTTSYWCYYLPGRDSYLRYGGW